MKEEQSSKVQPPAGKANAKGNPKGKIQGRLGSTPRITRGPSLNLSPS